MRFWGRLLREYFVVSFWGVDVGSLTYADDDVDFRYCAVLVVFMGNMPD